jgi:hypothetical protein
MNKSKGKWYSEEGREELLALFDQSGSSVSPFCKEMGLGKGALKQWLSRGPPRADLLEVAGPASLDGVSLRVYLPNGARCEIGGGFGCGEVAGLIRELKAC